LALIWRSHAPTAAKRQDFSIVASPQSKLRLIPKQSSRASVKLRDLLNPMDLGTAQNSYASEILTHTVADEGFQLNPGLKESVYKGLQ
jgi:hypothetical protein